MNSEILIPLLIFIVALLYSSVGHGGASGYLAGLGIMGVPISQLKPTALILNVFVSATAFLQYYRNGHFRWSLFWPFALLSVPMAFVGAQIELNPTLYKQILGVCLILAVLRIIGLFGNPKTEDVKKMPLIPAMLIGAGIGFLSGMMGIGGGIILTPVMLVFRWGKLKEIAAVSALFIFVNSISGIVALFIKGFELNLTLALWISVALIGGLIGSYIGSKKLNQLWLKNILAATLVFAAVKLILV